MDDNKWTIEGRKLFYNKEVKHLQSVRAGAIRQQILVTSMENEEFSLNLQSFSPAEPKDFDEQVKSSRTKFLQWLDFDSVQSTSFQETENQNSQYESMAIDSETNTGNLSKYEFNEKDESNDSCGDRDVSALHHLSTDRDILRKHIKGECVKVHIENLKEPESKYKVRDLDENHVMQIQSNIEKSHGIYTTLLGIVPPSLDPTTLHIPGSGQVEVIGGNHTREALQRLRQRKKSSFLFVNMDLYSNISEEQALHIAYQHNEMHEHSKPMSFIEKVLLFHHIIAATKEENKGKNSKDVSKAWRGKIATLTNKTVSHFVREKRQKNSFRVHFYIGSFSGELWQAVQNVFDAAKANTIKGLKNGDLTQYHFFHLSKLKNDTEKIDLLSQLANGDISAEEFRKTTSREQGYGQEGDKQMKRKGKTKVKVIDLDQQKDKTNPNEEIEKMKMDLQAEIKLREDSDRKIKELQGIVKQKDEEIKMLQDKEKRNADTKDRIKKLQQMLQQKDSEISRLKIVETKLLQKEVEVKDLSKKTSSLQTTINSLQEDKKKLDLLVESLKEQTVYAEEAAARARAKNQESENASTSEQPMKKTFSMNKEDHLVDKVQETKKRKRQVEKTEEAEFGLVEFNGQKLYLGMFKEKQFIFCHKPYGYIHNTEFVQSQHQQGLKINSKDRQTIDNNYIITRFKGQMSNKMIEETSIPNMACYVAQYLQNRKKYM